MTIRSPETLNKALISTTSHFVGEYEFNDVLFALAWPNFSDKSGTVRWSEGPASRSAFVLVFKTPPIEKGEGVMLPNYAGVPDLFAWYLSVLFGKRFDNHGLLESIGLYNVPNLEHFSSLCRHTLPHNSHQPRVDYLIPLNLVEINRIKPLLNNAGQEQSFIRIFQSAAKFYSQALQVFEQDAEVAYLHLVTAIEILSNSIESGAIELHDATTRHYLSEIESNLPEGKKIVRHFRGKLLSIKRRFVRTITDLVDDDFFTRSESSGQLGRFKLESFVKTVAAAYDLRSKYVHTGVPFGGWIERTVGGMNCEVQVGCPVVADRTYGKILANAPTFIGLERIVRYCLLRSAEKHGVYVSSSPL